MNSKAEINRRNAHEVWVKRLLDEIKRYQCRPQR
jgi:hypothetical protein